MSDKTGELIVRSQCRGASTGYREDDDEAAQDGEDLARLFGQEGRSPF